MVILGTTQNTEVTKAMVDKYVFGFSKHFPSSDRATLDPSEQQTLSMLAQILKGYFQNGN